MRCLGLHQGYGQFGLSIFTMHDQWVPPPAPLKFQPGLIEGPAFMGWHPTRRITQKVGKKTYFDGSKAVQQGHDVGYFILHLALPFNVMMAVNAMVSKHKIMLPVSKVLIEGRMMGTYLWTYLSLICANPVSLPTGALIPLTGTVIAELTFKDIVLGVCFIGVDMLIDALWSLVMKGDEWKLAGKVFKSKVTVPIYKKMLDKIYNKAMQGPLRSLIPRQFLSKLTDHLIKSWVASPLLAGAISQAAQPLTGLPRDVMPNVSIGRGIYLNVKFFPKLGVGGNVFN